MAKRRKQSKDKASSGKPASSPRKRVAVGILLVAMPVVAIVLYLTTRETIPRSGPETPLNVACGSCHKMPPPDSLPKDQWPDVIRSMAGEEMPTGQILLMPETLDRAIEHYTRLAPEQLPWKEPTAAVDDVLRFRRDELSPEMFRDQRIPAAANVNFVHLGGPDEWDLLIAEMRSRSLMILEADTSSMARSPAFLETELNYPVHTELADMNNDGEMDILVASLGGMNPNNEIRGSASVLIQRSAGQFTHHVVAESLGRVADVRAGDFDGDGDLDLTAAAFGWLGPGALFILENQTTDWARPRFERHELDTRDGYIHTEIADLNGDGRTDFVALLSQEHEQVIAYLNRGGLAFEPRILFQAEFPSWGHSGIQLVDMDQDGDDDILVTNGDSLDDLLLKPYHGVRWLENHGELRFESHEIAQLYGAQRAVAADMDSDGDLDVVAVAFLPHLNPLEWARLNLDSVIWVERTDDGWVKHAIEKHLCQHATVAVADYNHDAKPDIAVGNWVWLREDGSPVYEADVVTLFTAE